MTESKQHIKLVDCPRDAMQGIKEFIPTQSKIEYIQQLLAVGFDTLDVGSFVSPKAIPQMRDTAEVITSLDRSQSSTDLLVIVANYRGAEDAVQYDEVDYLGFPFSISETFQIRNTNATREEAFDRIREIKSLCAKHDKKLVIYFSMCFGNPYGDLWHPDIITYWADRFDNLGAKVIALSDTVGVGTPETIGQTVGAMRKTFPDLEFGVHLHTTPDTWKEKIDAAYEHGCSRYDGAIRGYGGCPMAQNDLVGNMPTENLVNYFENLGLLDYDHSAFSNAVEMSREIMP